MRTCDITLWTSLDGQIHGSVTSGDGVGGVVYSGSSLGSVMADLTLWIEDACAPPKRYRSADEASSSGS